MVLVAIETGTATPPEETAPAAASEPMIAVLRDESSIEPLLVTEVSVI